MASSVLSMVSSLSTINLTTFPHEVIFNENDAQNIIHGYQVSFALPRFENRTIISLTKYGCTRRDEFNPTVTRKIGTKLKKLITLGTIFFAVELDFSFVVIDIVQFCGVHCNKASFEERSHLISQLCQSGIIINQKPIHPIQKVQLHSTENTKYFPPGPKGYWIISSHSNPIDDDWKCIVDDIRCSMLVRRKVSYGNTIERFELEQKNGNITVIEIDTSQFPYMSTQEIVGKVVSLIYDSGRWILENCNFEQQLSTAQWIKSVVDHSHYPLVSRNLFHIEPLSLPSSPEYNPEHFNTYSPTSPASPQYNPENYDTYSPTSPASPQYNPEDYHAYSPASPQYNPEHFNAYSPTSPTSNASSYHFAPGSPRIPKELF